MEVRGFGVHVSLVEPGYIDTDIDNASLPYLDKCEKHSNAAAYQAQMKTFREAWSKGVDSGSSPDSIAKAVLHAATARSPRRRYTPNADGMLGKLLKSWFGYTLLDRLMPGGS
jgi:NAD(P)-dependent dehydrogenase (short-subunit alcohol dehydrogenase family)